MTKVINLKADLNTITENKIWGMDVVVNIISNLKLDFIWYKKNGLFPKNLIDSKQVYITHESINEIHGVGNGKPSEDLLKLLKENGNVNISQDYRTVTHRFIPKYNYGYIHEQFTCTECGKTYSTDDIISDYDDDGYIAFHLLFEGGNYSLYPLVCSGRL